MTKYGAQATTKTIDRITAALEGYETQRSGDTWYDEADEPQGDIYSCGHSECEAARRSGARMLTIRVDEDGNVTNMDGISESFNDLFAGFVEAIQELTNLADTVSATAVQDNDWRWRLYAWWAMDNV